MSFRIIKSGESFEVRNENNTLYGPVCSSQATAEALQEDWETYYAAPLRFVPVASSGNSQKWVEMAPPAPEPEKPTQDTQTVDFGVLATKLPEKDVDNIEDMETEMSPKPPFDAEPTIPPIPATLNVGGRLKLYFTDEERRREKARKLRIKRAWVDRVGLEVYRSMVKDSNPLIHAFPSGGVEQVAKSAGESNIKKPRKVMKHNGAMIVGIPYPAVDPEMKNHSNVYNFLRERRFNVHLNVPVAGGALDLVVFDPATPENPSPQARIVIEVKAGKQGWSENQKQKYQKACDEAGADLFLFNDSTSLDTLLENVREAFPRKAA